MAGYLAAAGPGGSTAGAVQGTANAEATAARAILDRYCVTCHAEKRPNTNQGLFLDVADPADVGRNPELWEKVVKKLRSGAMPPAGSLRPDKATYDGLTISLEGALDRVAAAAPNPGRRTIHRLNRAEYANAIRDLLGLEIDGRALLPSDDSGYGFDNIADVLSFSPGLLERYMSAARQISRIAVGDPSLRPAKDTYRVSFERLQNDRVNEHQPFGSRGGLAIRHTFPLDGDYTLRIKLQRTWRDEIRGLDRPNLIDVRVDRALVKRFTVGGDGPRATWLAGQAVPTPTDYEMNADADLEARFPVKAGPRVVSVSFVNDGTAYEGAPRALLPITSFEFAGDRDAPMGVDSVQVSGPYEARAPKETVSRQRIFVCVPARVQEEEPCARKILSTLGRRAYRREVTNQDVQTLMRFYHDGRRKGSFDDGILLALQALLVDPDFLFRVERDPVKAASGKPYRISDVELASRLSFFLWSSIPDEELLDTAIRGTLNRPATLEQQVRRMLADLRATALVSNFAGQWLWLRNMREVKPDAKAYPDFEDSLREAFQRETELFIESTLREDRRVADLLTANYTFVNERLARHYQIPNVYGSHFRRVTLPDARRGGLLGHGSVLTITSYTNRTSPVTRGKWLLENLLGAPPPPPPPNVPDLKEQGEDGKILSMRQRMQAHRANPVCASCHARMDPLGFALENFDAIGKWRTTGEDNAPIDSSGALPDGTSFDGPAELRAMLQSRRGEFVTALTEKLLTYALGRGLEPHDAPVVRKIVRDAAPGEYRWSALVMGIVKSPPFTLRWPSENP
jgi:hypothetical protein